ncbi:hypothetical protein, partial [Sphingomonas oligophenolica]|uniref:hypothetical protein n=1 Tax=Sphingomonas oligophenolica TaxID=301154 RepID=UPI0031DC58D6
IRCSTTPPWYIDTVGGRPPHLLPAVLQEMIFLPLLCWILPTISLFIVNNLQAISLLSNNSGKTAGTAGNSGDISGTAPHGSGPRHSAYFGHVKEQGGGDRSAPSLRRLFHELSLD